jgi:hypothetical protein
MAEKGRGANRLWIQLQLPVMLLSSSFSNLRLSDHALIGKGMLMYQPGVAVYQVPPYSPSVAGKSILFTPQPPMPGLLCEGSAQRLQCLLSLNSASRRKDDRVVFYKSIIYQQDMKKSGVFEPILG